MKDRVVRFFIPFVVALGLVQVPLRAQLPVVTNQPASRILWAGVNVSFAVSVSGSGPYSYQWQFNGTNLPSGIITTVAGSGGDGFYGDGGPATNAGLLNPFDVTVDAKGNLFIADTGNYRIREVDTNGIITTVAGNGDFNVYYGDGWPAIYAAINYPDGVAVDTNGNLFIADTSNHRIRKVDTNGIITTVVGNGGAGFSGDGGPAASAALFTPSRATIDTGGNLLIADTGNYRVRKVSAKGIIKTVAGNGDYIASGDGELATNANMRFPSGVAVDTNGNMFIADYASALIRKVDANGIITTVAGLYSSWTNGIGIFSGDGGAATNASLFNPTDVAVDGYGNLFIADQNNHRIRRVDANGIISTVAGNGSFSFSGDGGPATNASLSLPSGVTVDAMGNLFIADYFDERIRKVSHPSYLPTLSINGISSSDAGNYSVVVTSLSGSVTSSVATLIAVTSPLVYQAVPNAEGSVIFNCVSKPASTNIILYATNLLSPVFWKPISTNMAGIDGDWHFVDTNIISHRMRFYRFQMR